MISQSSASVSQRTPWTQLAQQFDECPIRKSIGLVCSQPNPGSQPLDGNVPLTLFTSYLGERLRLDVVGVRRRLGNSRGAEVDQSFQQLSVCFLDLLWHLSLIRRMLTELLELLRHLCHLFRRHTVRLSYPHHSRVAIHRHRADHDQTHSTATKPQESNTAAPVPCSMNMSVNGCPARCAFLSGQCLKNGVSCSAHVHAFKSLSKSRMCI